MAAKRQAERLRRIAPREIVHAAISLGFAEYSDNARWIKISSGNGIIDAAYIRSVRPLRFDQCERDSAYVKQRPPG